MKLHKIATNTASGLTTSVYMFDDMIATNVSSNTTLQGEDILLRHNIDKKALYIEYRPVHPIFANSDNCLLYRQNKAKFVMQDDEITDITFNRENPVHNMIISSIKKLFDVDLFDLKLHPEYLNQIVEKERQVNIVDISDCMPLQKTIDITHIKHFFDIQIGGTRMWKDEFTILSERYGNLTMDIIKTKNLMNEKFKVTIKGLQNERNEDLQAIFGDVIERKQDLRNTDNKAALLSGVTKTNLVYDELSPLIHALGQSLSIYLPCIDYNAFNAKEYVSIPIID
jgi:hypothetical protein